MFHGNKKKENTKILTEEEIKKSEGQLHKIKIIQKEILDRKEKNDLDEKNLELLLKVASIMPDFYTLWNYRKKIILDLKSKKQNEEFIVFLKNEINQISYFQKTNPKSYVLWNHRIWCLQLGSNTEKELDIQLESSLLNSEINNCNYFLEKDDRNFHVWNHRLTIFNLIRENFKENFSDFLLKELNFTIAMIKKNCSNFSAWHYRSKLIPLYFVMNNIGWNTEEALNYLETDLNLIITAVFTDPKDQSAWNYHMWIVNSITPPYVESIFIDEIEKKAVIKFSDIFKYKRLYKCVSSNGEESDIIKSEKEIEFSDKIEVDLLNGLEGDKFEIRNRLNDHDQDSSSYIENACFSRNNLAFPDIFIEVKEGLKVVVNKGNFKEFHSNFLTSQLEKLENLIKNSEIGFLEYAHFRKVQILTILYHNSDRSDSIKNQINEEYDLLQANSKRMKRMYEDFKKKLQ